MKRPETRRFFLGYNTNGLAHHALPDACRLLQSAGYEGVAVTLDHDLLMRTETDDFVFRTPPTEIARTVKSHGLRCVVETGARFLLDYDRKHKPDFFSADDFPDKTHLRKKYYYRAIELAAETQSTCVSIWTGMPSRDLMSPHQRYDADMREALLPIFFHPLLPVLEYARRLGVKVALEPEPGMFVETAEEYSELLAELEKLDTQAAAELYLTLDTGHMVCNGEPIVETFLRYKDRLVNVHLDDAVWGTHEHLELGWGELNFRHLEAALDAAKFSGGVCVELSRHSHEAPAVVRRTRDFIRKEWNI